MVRRGSGMFRRSVAMRARLAAHFGRCLAVYALAKGTDAAESRRARAEADFQTRRALRLAPENEEVKKLRAEVVRLLDLPASINEAGSPSQAEGSPMNAGS